MLRRHAHEYVPYKGRPFPSRINMRIKSSYWNGCGHVSEFCAAVVRTDRRLSFRIKIDAFALFGRHDCSHAHEKSPNIAGHIKRALSIGCLSSSIRRMLYHKPLHIFWRLSSPCQRFLCSVLFLLSLFHVLSYSLFSLLFFHSKNETPVPGSSIPVLGVKLNRG